MSTPSNTFDASTLCSRKLWQLLQRPDTAPLNDRQQQQVIRELATRRHYVAELTRLGRINPSNHH